MAKTKRMEMSALNTSELDVTVQGTAPLVLLPLGVFKGEQLIDNHDKFAEALKLYLRHDGKPGLPAGALKQCICEAVAKLDKDTRNAVDSGFHVIGEDETNMVALEGEPHGEDFVFSFKKPKRVITLTLPVLDSWTATFRVHFMTSIISRKNVERFLSDAGRKVGVGHRRPSKGTFKIKKVVPVTTLYRMA